MIEDAENRSEGRFDLPFDVCIIGAGPAGITLARRLAGQNRRVGLFEAGGFEATAESQEVYEGQTAGTPDYYALDGCRLRFLGGTSNHWGGWTRPFDPWDFDENPNNPLSGWPIAKTDLDPYAAEAADILDLTADTPPPDMLGDASPFLPRLFRFSRPVVRFGEKYRQELSASKDIELVLNANLVDLRLDGNRISEAVFRSYARPDSFAVRAKLFVICLGGLENPRALLNATSQVNVGIGNENGYVGRCFLEHPHAPVGKVVTREPLDWMHVYAPTPDTMHSLGVLNFGLRIGNEGQWNAPDFYGPLTQQPACDVPFDTMLLAAVNGEAPPCPAHFSDALIACEQKIDPDNRVVLTDERDRFGLRRMRLDWSVSEQDLKTLRVAASEMATLLAKRDLGRMKIIDWLANGEAPQSNQLWGGNHHMGTTRMSADPKRGVVDANCRVHTVNNLYCGGSSVFSTSGHANPTYTIVQLALRLGDHLDQII
ncbi:GMC oxidoreductase [Hoeflea olei]|uniref:Glucose-methanol-choline oxidoreductase C-terminal domain-containing protein n=1 Tax=Hoeflea olei TaxID=1480615 RepID=A0A1C1YT67_9HYPH|nr:GMC family oxidoreductase [Hoeflea olei]OCW56540.1 hypothetical protein AWJ14_16470 [Hoeflea olei]